MFFNCKYKQWFLSCGFASDIQVFIFNVFKSGFISFRTTYSTISFFLKNKNKKS